MKATSVIREIDQLGRFVLPKEMRDSLGIKAKTKTEPGSQLEIYVEGENIILSKYEPGCVFCGEIKETMYYKGKFICSKCKEYIGGTKL